MNLSEQNLVPFKSGAVDASGKRLYFCGTTEGGRYRFLSKNGSCYMVRTYNSDGSRFDCTGAGYQITAIKNKWSPKTGDVVYVHGPVMNITNGTTKWGFGPKLMVRYILGNVMDTGSNLHFRMAEFDSTRMSIDKYQESEFIYTCHARQLTKEKQE